MKAERFDAVTVVTPDAAAARATFENHFGFVPVDAGQALRIGGARIVFETPEPGSPLAGILAASGEGMATIRFAVASLAEAATTLERAGVAFTREPVEGREALHVDPTAAHGVRLVLVAAR